MKRFVKFLILSISIFSVIGTSVLAASNIKTENLVFETTDTEYHYTFANRRDTDDGAEYLKDVDYTVLSSTPVVKSQEITYEVKQENLYGQDEFDPEQSITIQKDGQEVSMILDHIEYSPTMIKNRTHEVTGYTDFGYKTIKPTPEQRKAVDYYDEITGKTISTDLPLISMEIIDDWSWKRDVKIPITFHLYDSEYYTLGNKLIPYNEVKPALGGYEKELLETLGLDKKSYRITDFNWDGKAIELNNKTLQRNATAVGERYVANYVAYYADEVNLPDAPGYNAVAYYKGSLQVPTGETLYKVRATAYYEPRKNYFVPILLGATTGIVAIFFIAWFTLNNVLVYQNERLICRTRVKHGAINIKRCSKRIQGNGTIVIKRRYVMRHAGNTISILLGNQLLKTVILPISHEDFKTGFTI